MATRSGSRSRSPIVGRAARARGPRAAARAPRRARRVSGWSNARRVACRNWRSRPSRPGVPYSGSPHTGWPIARRWTRIWWVRPVSRRSRSSEVRSKRALEREVGARLARVGAADGHARAHARVAPDRRLDRPRARRRAALDQRQVLALDQPLATARPAAAGGPPPSARRRAAPRCRGRADGRSPPARDRRRPRFRPSSWASVTSRCPRAGCTTRPGPLVDHQQVLVLVGDRERRRHGVDAAQRDR